MRTHKFFCAALAALIIFFAVLAQGQEQDSTPSKYEGEKEALAGLEQQAMLLRLVAELEARRLAMLEMATAQLGAQEALEKAADLHKKQAVRLGAADAALKAAEERASTAEARAVAADERLGVAAAALKAQRQAAAGLEEALESERARAKAAEALAAATRDGRRIWRAVLWVIWAGILLALTLAVAAAVARWW